MELNLRPATSKAMPARLAKLKSDLMGAMYADSSCQVTSTPERAPSKLRLGGRFLQWVHVPFSTTPPPKRSLDGAPHCVGFEKV